MAMSHQGICAVRRSLLLAPFAWALPARAQPAIPELLLDHAGRLLATLIQVGRETAIAAGVKPVPAQIKRALLGFFPDHILRKARYFSGQSDTISIPGLNLAYGDAEAVALVDTILFRDDIRAREDAKLWAHELTHVLQYERWGVEGFAARYVRDYQSVEREARDNADKFVSWSRHVRA
jgi:hypothetical protein